MYNRYNNLYKSHNLKQYEQALSAKLEAENQVRILKQQEKPVLFKICCCG
jgi:membrane fusion protein (multidrug efflux system)